MGWKPSFAILALSALAVPAFAQSELDNWEFGGHLDVYYMKNLNHPPTGMTNQFRKYDIFNRSPHLADFMIHARRKQGNGLPFGIHMDLAFGKNADINNAYEPAGSNRYKEFRQFYISFEPNDKWGIDIGKFEGMMGMEGSDSGSNMNYSQSFTRTFTQPDYHAGARAAFNLSDKLWVGFAGLNGWNEVEDSNDEMSFMGGFGYNGGSWNLTASGYFGTEGSNSEPSGFVFPQADVTIFDVVATCTAINKWTFGFNGTWAEAEVLSGPTVSWNGMAGYAKYQINDTWSIAGRFERFDDEDGARLETIFDGSPPDGYKLDSTTITVDYQATEKSKIRFEYRADKGNQNFFPDGSSGSKDTMNTWSLSYYVKF